MTQARAPAPSDLQLRFLLPSAGVRGVLVQLDQTWRAMAARAAYPPAVAELLGEAAAAAALFTGHAKVDGRLSVQLRSHGALRTLFAECTAAGTLRGIARLQEDASEPGAATPSRDLRSLGNDAVLAITIENPALGGREPMRYQGLVERWAGHAARCEPINLTRDLSEVTLGIVLRALFGSDLDRLIASEGSSPFDCSG